MHEVAYGNWNEFLCQKAEAGNIVVLAVLQSSKQGKGRVFEERPVEKLLEGMTYSVDNEGNITYFSKCGGKVTDFGKMIVVSGDGVAQKFADRLKKNRKLKHKSRE